MSQNRYRYSDLVAWVEAVLGHFGVPADDARVGARCLVDADLSGIDTHGLYNFPTHWHYAPGLRSGGVPAHPQITVLRDSPVSAAWDVGSGFGPIMAHKAMSTVIDKAAATGIGMLTWRNGCHFGALGYLARMAAEQQMVGMVMADCPAGAVAPGGLDKLYGTNPMAFAAPVAGSHPLVFDVATTAAAGTKLVVAREEGTAIPAGWALDADGEITTDPRAAAKGAYLPLGYLEGGGHKGFALGLMVDVLSGVMAGNGSGAFQVFGPDWRQGAWFAAWRVDAFVDVEEFTAEMARLVERIRSSRPAPGAGPVLAPGDRSAATRAERARLGIPLTATTIQRNRALGVECGIAFPAPVQS